MLKDSFGRKFPYIRLSITDVCNFKCGYCLPNGYQVDKSDNKSDNEDLSNAFMKFILTEEFQNIIPLNNWSFPVKLPKENWPIEFQNLPKPRNSIYLDEKKSSEIKSTAIEEWLEAMSK